MGITPLPFANATMRWKEWDFMQCDLGFFSIVFGFFHVIIYVYKLRDPNYENGWTVWQLNPNRNSFK